MLVILIVNNSVHIDTESYDNVKFDTLRTYESGSELSSFQLHRVPDTVFFFYRLTALLHVDF